MVERLNAISDALMEKFGLKHQDMVLVEEMSELTKEIVKHHNRGCENSNALKEECADVCVALYQFIRNNGIEDDVNKCVSEKVERVENRYLTKFEDADGIIKELDDICREFFDKTDKMFEEYRK